MGCFGKNHGDDNSVMDEDIAAAKAKARAEEQKASAPHDTFLCVYWITFLVGVTCMLPSDMMVTVNGYWHYKFRNTSLDDVTFAEPEGSAHLTRRQKEFESYISIASSVPSAFVIVAHAWIGNRFTVHGRAMLSLFGIIATSFGFMALAYVDSDEWATLFLICNLTLAVIINIFRALFRATNSAHMGRFPVRYMGSLASGVTMGGLVPVVVNILILSNDVDIQYYSSNQHILDYDREHEVVINWDVFCQVMRRSWVFVCVACLVTATTAVVYPAATSLVRPARPTDSDWHQIYFTQVMCFLTFNVCNYLGTVAAGLLQWPGDTSVNSQVTLLLLCSLRVVFVPTFMMCNLAPNDRDIPIYLKSDAAFTVVMVLFSLSDGYVTNMTMMFGPKSAKQEHQEITAGILVAAIAASITAGSIFSNFIVKAL